VAEVERLRAALEEAYAALPPTGMTTVRDILRTALAEEKE
jgi:hypothetical protein